MEVLVKIGRIICTEFQKNTNKLSCGFPLKISVTSGTANELNDTIRVGGFL